MQLFHGRVPVEFHELKAAKGRPLLLLHALGSNSESWPDTVLDWSEGPVYAIDFAGHGASDPLRGGAYYPEHFLADADLALERLGEPCALLGAGIGAYVALLLAGARPTSVSGAYLLGGEGLEGVGSKPGNELSFDDVEGFELFIAENSKPYTVGTDPLVAQCAGDMRPTEYAAAFAEAARPLLFSPSVGVDRPSPAWWLAAVEANRGVVAPEDLSKGLTALAAMVSQA
ncbi:MAG: alpha/beta fold hydrolase [Myxococcota bacterium]